MLHELFLRNKFLQMKNVPSMYFKEALSVWTENTSLNIQIFHVYSKTIFSFRIEYFRSLINLKFCKRGRKKKNTNIPLSKANSAESDIRLLKKPQVVVRDQLATGFLENKILQTGIVPSESRSPFYRLHIILFQNQTNTWLYIRIILTNAGSLPSSSARLNLLWSLVPCPTDTIAQKTKQLHKLDLTQGASNKVKGTYLRQK